MNPFEIYVYNKHLPQQGNVQREDHKRKEGLGICFQAHEEIS
jgi:hypothetical protein